MKWKDNGDRTRGVELFRMVPPRLRALPAVVGKRQGVKGIKLQAEVRNISPGLDNIKRSNTHLPGSVDYIAAFPAPPVKKIGRHAAPMDFASMSARRQNIPTSFQPAGHTMNWLDSVLKNKTQQDGGS